MDKYNFNNGDVMDKVLNELIDKMGDPKFSKSVSHEQIEKLVNTRNDIVGLERKRNRNMIDTDVAKKSICSLVSEFESIYNTIAQSVEKTDCNSDPELDKYLYLMMDWCWCNREDGRYSHDIKEAELYHWFDSINSVEHRKKDILTKLDEMPTYLKQAMTPIANFIISSLDIIIKLAKENYMNKKDTSKLTDEYVEKLADYAYIFYYTYNNLSVIYRKKIIGV